MDTFEERVFNIAEVKSFNSQSGWFVSFDEDGTKVVGTAILPPYGRIMTECEFRRDQRWGNQYFVNKIRYERIEDLIEPLLASGFLAYIKEKKAKKITEKFGAKFFVILEAACDPEMKTIEWNGLQRNPSELLQDADGVGPVVAKELVGSWMLKRKYFRAAIDAIRCELSPKQFMWAISNSGYEEFSAMVHSDAPYSIYDLLEIGLPWERVDTIAMTEWEDKPAIAEDSPVRMAGAVKYALHRITSEDGHMCAPETAIAEKCIEIGIIDPLTKLGNPADYGLIERGEMLFTKNNFEIEQETAMHIVRLIRYKDYFFEKITANDIARFSEFAPNPEQLEAVRVALTSKVCVITGGPGTGKTTTLKTITNILHSKNKSFVLCAPTGNAARRMAVATGFPAFTLHRYFALFRDITKQEHYGNGTLVIDEMSMTPSDILRDVLRNLTDDTHLVLVGDVDQLPPVGKGEPLLQVIEAGVPVVRLAQIYRQGKNSAIIGACHAINRGEMPELESDKIAPEERTFVFRSISRSEISETVIKAIDWLRATRGAKPDDIQVLTPVNKDSQGKGVGQSELNLVLRELFNPEWRQNPTPVDNFSIGDKVVQRKNNYNLGTVGIMNGQIGIVKEITPDGYHAMRMVKINGAMPAWADDQTKLFTVEFEEGELASYTRKDAPALALAYAMTIHKSQGGQFPHVIVVVPHTWEGFRYRQLVYTACSRPKQTLIIIEQHGATQEFVENENKMRRYSMLAQLIKKEMETENALSNS